MFFHVSQLKYVNYATQFDGEIEWYESIERDDDGTLKPALIRLFINDQSHIISVYSIFKECSHLFEKTEDDSYWFDEEQIIGWQCKRVRLNNGIKNADGRYDMLFELSAPQPSIVNHTSSENFDDNREAQEALKILQKSNTSLFLTGKAGTGKSSFLRYFLKNTSKNYIVLAPTGIAALNVDGQTIHSFFEIEFRPYAPNDKHVAFLNLEKREIIRKLDLIIIDEISMVRADLMNAIDLTLRKNTETIHKNLPFAGKQLLLIGDLFQLSPVVKENEREVFLSQYKTPYFFSAPVFDNHPIYKIELKKVYRQSDSDFIRLLDCVRTKQVNASQISKLNSRVQKFNADDNDLTITLATTNTVVEDLNAQRLKQLSGREYSYSGSKTGDFGTTLPVEEELKLKIGSQIMFVKNDPTRRWVNGTIAKISDLYNGTVEVELDNGRVYDVEPATWEKSAYELDKEKETIIKTVIGTYTQLPLKLAWSITIHKSQGLTFEKVIIDLGKGAFSHGQTYVALSRCTSFEGLFLSKPIREFDIKVDEQIKTYVNQPNQCTPQYFEDEEEDEEYDDEVEVEEEPTLDEIILENDDLKEEIERLEEQVGALNKNIVALNQANQNARNELNRTNDALNRTKNELAQLKIVNSEKIKQIEKANVESEKQIAESQKIIDSQRFEISKQGNKLFAFYVLLFFSVAILAIVMFIELSIGSKKDNQNVKIIDSNKEIQIDTTQQFEENFYQYPALNTLNKTVGGVWLIDEEKELSISIGISKKDFYKAINEHDKYFSIDYFIKYSSEIEVSEIIDIFSDLYNDDITKNKISMNSSVVRELQDYLKSGGKQFHVVYRTGSYCYGCFGYEYFISDGERFIYLQKVKLD